MFLYYVVLIIIILVCLLPVMSEHQAVKLIVTESILGTKGKTSVYRPQRPCLTVQTSVMGVLLSNYCMNILHI